MDQSRRRSPRSWASQHRTDSRPPRPEAELRRRHPPEVSKSKAITAVIDNSTMNWLSPTEAGGGAPSTPSARGLEVERDDGGGRGGHGRQFSDRPPAGAAGAQTFNLHLSTGR